MSPMLKPAHLLVQFKGWKSLPVILQSEVAECGLACLAMVSAYYGNKCNLAGIRRHYSISQRGASLQQLMQLAQSMEMNTRALKLELKDLPKLQTPAVLHWDMNHFVVLKQVRRNTVLIHDPAVGERKLSLATVVNHFTGVALELTPTTAFKPRSMSVQLKLSQLWSHITGLKRGLGKTLLLSIVLQALVLAAPYYTQLVVDDVLLSFDKDLLIVLAFGFGLVVLTKVLAQVIRSYVILHLSSLMNIQLAANLFRHLLHLPLSYFHKRHVGDVISRFSSLQHIKDFLSQGAVEALMDGGMAVITLAMLFLYSPSLAWVVVACVMIYGFVRLLLYKPLRQKSEEAIIAQAKEQSNFIENVQAIQTIKLFSCEPKRQAIWQNRYADTLNSNIRIGKLSIGFVSANGILFGLENIVVIYLAATLIMAGDFSIGMLFAFVSYKQLFSERVANLIEKLIELKMLGLHLERLADIALSPVESNGDEGASIELQGSIVARDLSFQYAPEEPFLFRNVSFTVEKGESVAIIAPSGGGKSTLLKLLLGLLGPSEGCVEVDGCKLDQIRASDYRSQIASVMQDDQLLTGSLAENISFFDSNMDMERVVQCAEMAVIHHDIMSMPMNYNSLIGDVGSSLSGGQKQRVLLARALYQQPKILFLDEATSHLDMGHEAMVNQAISKLSLTRIIVAHRPETMLTADRILQLNGEGIEDVTQEIRQQLGAVA